MASVAVTGARPCYSRNGTRIQQIAYLPCNNDVSHDSYCCGINHQGSGDTKVADDACEPNGLCQNYEAYDPALNNTGVKLWWRQGCTDPTWQSDYCLKDICNFGEWKNENAPVRKCDNDKWCCGDRDCCNTTSSLFQLAATIGPTTIPTLTPSLSLASTSSGAVATVTGGGSNPNGSDAQTTQGLSNGMKVGIGIGVAIIVILLGIIAVLMMRWKQRKQRQDGSVTEKEQGTIYAHEVAPVELSGESMVQEMGGRAPQEMTGDSKPQEMGERAPQELGDGIPATKSERHSGGLK